MFVLALFAVSLEQVASRCSSLAPLLQQQQQPALPAWSLLALFLAELRYRGELAHSQRGSGSVGGDGDSDQESVPPGMAKWLPYLEALPASPGTVLEWPKQQVRMQQPEAAATIAQCADVHVQRGAALGGAKSYLAMTSPASVRLFWM